MQTIPTTAEALLGLWNTPAVERARRLSPAGRAVHQAILAAFTDAGGPPAAESIDAAARAAGGDPTAVRAELAALDLIHTDPNGAVTAAYPFSGVATGHRVAIAGGPTAWSMCAIDALGISAMLDRAVLITSTEPDTGAAITVAVDRDQATWTPATAIVYLGATDCCGAAAERTCRHLNFFTTADAANAHAARNPTLSGVLLNQEQALALAVRLFAGLVHTPGS
jgi:hypothetical protein